MACHGAEVHDLHPEVGAHIHGGDKHKMPSMKTDGAHATRHTGHEVQPSPAWSAPMSMKVQRWIHGVRRIADRPKTPHSWWRPRRRRQHPIEHGRTEVDAGPSQRRPQPHG